MISSNLMERAITANNCPECKEPKGDHVYRHLLSVHAWTPERVEALKVERRNRKALGEDGDGEILRCECGLLFKTSVGLRKHRSEKHRIQALPIIPISCPLCEAAIKDHESLVEHVSLHHTDSPEDYKIEMETFRDKKDFEDWKSELEHKAVARFCITRTRNYSSCVVRHYVCSRAGRFPSYWPTSTKKVVPYCTAHMKVRESAEKIVVRFCKTHCGHEIEPALLSLDKKSTEYVVSLLKQGFGARQIVDRVRKEYRGVANQNRLYYISAADVRLIAKRQNLVLARRHSADNACVPDNSEMMLHKFNEIRTYLCGIQANLYSMVKHPSDDSVQRMNQLAECMKQHYMDTRAENSDAQKREQRLAWRSGISETGRLPKHPPIRIEKRSVLDAGQRPKTAEKLDLIECETDDHTAASYATEYFRTPMMTWASG